MELEQLNRYIMKLKDILNRIIALAIISLFAVSCEDADTNGLISFDDSVEQIKRKHKLDSLLDGKEIRDVNFSHNLSKGTRSLYHPVYLFQFLQDSEMQWVLAKADVFPAGSNFKSIQLVMNVKSIVFAVSGFDEYVDIYNNFKNKGTIYYFQEPAFQIVKEIETTNIDEISEANKDQFLQGRQCYSGAVLFNYRTTTGSINLNGLSTLVTFRSSAEKVPHSDPALAADGRCTRFSFTVKGINIPVRYAPANYDVNRAALGSLTYLNLPPEKQKYVTIENTYDFLDDNYHTIWHAELPRLFYSNSQKNDGRYKIPKVIIKIRPMYNFEVVADNKVKYLDSFCFREGDSSTAWPGDCMKVINPVERVSKPKDDYKYKCTYKGFAISSLFFEGAETAPGNIGLTTDFGVYNVINTNGAQSSTGKEVTEKELLQNLKKYDYVAKQ